MDKTKQLSRFYDAAQEAYEKFPLEETLAFFTLKEWKYRGEKVTAESIQQNLAFLMAEVKKEIQHTDKTSVTASTGRLQIVYHGSDQSAWVSLQFVPFESTRTN